MSALAILQQSSGFWSDEVLSKSIREFWPNVARTLACALDIFPPEPPRVTLQSFNCLRWRRLMIQGSTEQPLQLTDLRSIFHLQSLSKPGLDGGTALINKIQSAHNRSSFLPQSRKRTFESPKRFASLQPLLHCSRAHAPVSIDDLKVTPSVRTQSQE